MHYFNCSAVDGKLWITELLCDKWGAYQDGVVCGKVDEQPPYTDDSCKYIQ